VRFSPGCRCCGCAWSFHVTGQCGDGDRPAVVIELRQSGSLIDSGSTNAFGDLGFGDLPAGSYDVTATPPDESGYTAYTGTIAHVCGETTTITLAPDVGHFCGSCSACPEARQLSLTVNPTPDGSGLVDDTLTWNDHGSWVGAHEFPFDEPGGVGHYELSCSEGVFTLVIRYDWTDMLGPHTLVAAVGGGTISSCHPYKADGTIHYGTYTGTWSAVG
jgi:hypothetical protein